MDAIKFLGTAGARFVMMKQLRATGGLWLTLDDITLLIDPGPGSLVRCLTSKPKLDPQTLDGIVLTHRHLDHANDINIMIEAMTKGGFEKKGIVLAPHDALDVDPVVLQYVRAYVNEIKPLELHQKYTIGTVHITPAVQHKHGVETFGLNIQSTNHSLSLIVDTEYFEGLEDHYTGDLFIINVVRYEPRPGIQHLCVKDVETILQNKQPKRCVLTHFGMTLLKAKPWDVAEMLSKKTGVDVIAARDGMTLTLD
jgi:phosphoribosyl 1,2-cyclic phosphodiesterase